MRLCEIVTSSSRVSSQTLLMFVGGTRRCRNSGWAVDWFSGALGREDANLLPLLPFSPFNPPASPVPPKHFSKNTFRLCIQGLVPRSFPNPFSFFKQIIPPSLLANQLLGNTNKKLNVYIT